MSCFFVAQMAGRDDITGEPLVQRDDDKPEVVKARLERYQKEADPILNHYRQQKLLIRFSGNQSKMIYTDLYAYLSNNFGHKEG